MGELIHTSKIRIVQHTPPLREGFIEHFEKPVQYGMHTAVAMFYSVPEGSIEEMPSTLDHMISAIAA